LSIRSEGIEFEEAAAQIVSEAPSNPQELRRVAIPVGLSRLIQAVEFCDVTEIERALDELMGLGQNDTPLCRHLRKLAVDMDFSNITTSLREWTMTEPGVFTQ
jgi:hypothetical protein